MQVDERNIVEKTEAEEENVWNLRHAGMFAWKKGRFEI